MNPLSWFPFLAAVGSRASRGLLRSILAALAILGLTSAAAPASGQEASEPPPSLRTSPPASVSSVSPLPVSSLTEAAERLRARSRSNREAALRQAARKGWVVRGRTPDGVEFELVGLDSRGAPLYNRTLTRNATRSLAAEFAHAPPLEATGAGIPVGIWDNGAARPTHQEFADTTPARVLSMDNAPVAAHATSVTGMAIAAGIDPGVLGTAPAALAWNFDWNEVEAELLEYGVAHPDDAQRPQVSNHSYGFLHGWMYSNFAGATAWYWVGPGYRPDGTGLREDLHFGRYGEKTAELDAIAAATPYSLPVRAAGNDRADRYSGPTNGTGHFYYFDETLESWASTTYTLATAPLDENRKGGFDTIITRAAAKNVLTVGSVASAMVGGVRDPAAAAMTAYSGWGPTDDGRIKPDVVAVGHSVRTVSFTGDANYGKGSGTSFATGSASGSVVLLVDAARRFLPAWRPRASTLKALVIHGASDVGPPGPDPMFGWGLIDAHASATVLAEHATTATATGGWRVLEGFLDDTATTQTYTVLWDGTRDLVATLCWTDPPGPVAPEGVLDPVALCLVHDLDLRLVGPGGVFLPFRLDPNDPAAPALRADNPVDPVEQVRLAPGDPGATPGTYAITVSYKGTLAPKGQWYSLVATGHDSFTSATDPVVLAVEPAETIHEPDATVSVAVRGEGFRLGGRLLLRRGEGEDGAQTVWASGVSVAPDRLFGVLALSELAPGDWDVVVENPDGRSGSLPGGLRIEKPSRVEDWPRMSAVPLPGLGRLDD